MTAPELQQRKATIIAELKRSVIRRIELDHGYVYEFDGNDLLLDHLVAFIKTERMCCDFFTFLLEVNGQKTTLTITGPEGAKAFLTSELEL